MALRDSLAKLQTDWIDILYVHWWDYATSIEEVMDGLHNVVQVCLPSSGLTTFITHGLKLILLPRYRKERFSI